MRTAILTVCLVAALAGCGADEPDSTSADQPSSSPPTSAESQAADKDGDGTPDSEDFYPANALATAEQVASVSCDSKGGPASWDIDRVKPDWKSVWGTPLPLRADDRESGMVYCEVDETFAIPVSPIEQAIWSKDKSHDEYTLTIPYEECAQHGTPWMKNEWPVSPGQVKEAETALLLCPRHPDGPAIRSRIADMKKFNGELKTGNAFADGNFRVGDEIKPGTYYTEDVTNCYWERLDSSGNIIDNNFRPDGIRVEVTIESSDFSFNSEGCKTWRRTNGEF